MTRQNYFEYKGKKYPAGTVTVLSSGEKAVFYETMILDSGTKRYLVKINDKVINTPGCYFVDKIVSVTNEQSVDYIQWAYKNHLEAEEKEQYTFRDELRIDGLCIAWMWYVFIMLIAIIFNDRFLIWFFASIIFFSYRNNKLKEARYK